MSQDVTPAWGSVIVDPSQPSLPSLKIRFLLDHVSTSGKVLEVGSGGGKVLRTLAHYLPKTELFGCDVTDPQVPAKEYTFRKIEDGIPYEAASFDSVLLFDVLEHVPDPAKLLADVARVLKPSGNLVAFIPIEGEPISFYEVFRRLLGSDLYAETKEHIQAFTHAGLASLLANSFDVKTVKYAYHPLGQAMDAAFFAAMRLKRIQSFWWKDNSLYHGKKTGTPALSRALNLAMEAANAVAWAESTALSATRVGSAGVLVSAGLRRPRS